MQAGQIEIQEFRPEHLDAAAGLSRQADWPHRKEDWAFVLSLSRGFVAVENGRVVGTTMATLFADACACINMVIVDQSMRGHGLGRTLMNTALEAAGPRECRLVATDEGRPLYEKMGFVATGEVLQHHGHVAPVDRPAGVEWADATIAAELAALDRQAFGADRTALFAELARQGRFAVLRKDGAIAAFAGLRAFGRGEVAGPVVATDIEAAKAVLSFIFAERTGAFLRVDTDAKTGLASWLAGHGLAHAGGGLPMRRGGGAPSAAAPMTTFALTSQALG
ncbi:GNAT family N-acetyltransferase [Rhizobiaceae bacterium BDR2-2]|uniref:GNAT family N-acetyltransferase n=1 Tax=Ectorhizobium quercum TaxID=2965071 RepID=A0AAE3MZP0_9HYPH|nr:GNAT family N-acetyltransferase [Ectorhizobium quercum]MCX8997317.1 GNAT family N-acetyltransferase [Ectorhizobium quercum]